MSRIDRGRLRRLVGIAMGLVALILAVALVPPFVAALVPAWLQKRIGLGILWGVLLLYAAAVVLAPVAVFGSLGLLVRRGRAGSGRVRQAFRGLALGLSTLLALGVMEAGAWVYRLQAERLPPLPEPPPRSAGEGSDRVLRLLVLGESSARGEPFDPRLSVGQIVAWQLERVFPGRRVEVEMRAQPGIGLDLALTYLRNLSHRPDAILLYSGHNEFQSRFSWSRSVAHYRQDPQLARGWPLIWAARWSSVCRLIDQAMETHRLSFPPPQKVTRQLVDHPTCTPAEYDGIVEAFRGRLEHLVAYCERHDIPLWAVSPPGNEGDYPPCRSVLRADTDEAARAAFDRDFEAIRALETSDPSRAVAGYRALLERQPGFAETHFRLARLLEAAGRHAEARVHFILARDLDGLPMRCPSRLLDVYREVAQRHPRMILVDGPTVLGRTSPTGIIDDHLIQDGQHPTLIGYVALAQDLLDQLPRRGAFGWPADVPAPTIDLADCADHFGIDRAVWADVCRRAASFYQRTAHIRFDPSESLAKARRLEQAAEAIESGTAPENTGIPGLGLRLPAGAAASP